MRCYVTHGEYGQGPFIEVPICVRAQNLGHRVDERADDSFDWGTLPVHQHIDLKFDADDDDDEDQNSHKIVER